MPLNHLIWYVLNNHKGWGRGGSKGGGMSLNHSIWYVLNNHKGWGRGDASKPLNLVCIE